DRQARRRSRRRRERPRRRRDGRPPPEGVARGRRRRPREGEAVTPTAPVAAEKKVLARMRGVTRVYERGGQALVVLDHLDLDIGTGEFLALMGPSGSGKSTILNLLGGLDRPDSGTVDVAGIVVSDLGSADLAAWRARNVGFVFQAFNL